jgi:hypothetical protein
MATISNSTTEDAEFTPAAGDFLVQATNGAVDLLRKNASGAAFASVGQIDGQAMIVSNPIAGAVYKWRRASGAPAFQADQ